uniref:Uncharacterized protein n=1 Tax=Chromera velia CCMP2878 TaxID=1169474 RepID=A0A0G4IEY3_9ALVE|eukprot:Cvel_13819.t1-p1 / transcript=Cvel_13819.t1 / gene=Cvel_13819 / organism=Chromera_velia_CCMP2878 / gene_product=hypothetical protein / transcript_product=hypothetical protein / location=Cvel_scaffold959:30067-30834(-) / protein_length=256 / sequence_SO=supercontig / SO=protein_coding / is_pseudo=false
MQPEAVLLCLFLVIFLTTEVEGLSGCARKCRKCVADGGACIWNSNGCFCYKKIQPDTSGTLSVDPSAGGSEGPGEGDAVESRGLFATNGASVTITAAISSYRETYKSSAARLKEKANRTKCGRSSIMISDPSTEQGFDPVTKTVEGVCLTSSPGATAVLHRDDLLGEESDIELDFTSVDYTCLDGSCVEEFRTMLDLDVANSVSNALREQADFEERLLEASLDALGITPVRCGDATCRAALTSQSVAAQLEKAAAP